MKSTTVFTFFHEEKQKLKNGVCPILVWCTKNIRSQPELMAAAHYRTVSHCQSVDALMPISSNFCWATQNWFACHRIRLFCRWPRNVPAALVRAWLLRGIPWIGRKLSLFDLQVQSIDIYSVYWNDAMLRSQHPLNCSPQPPQLWRTEEIPQDLERGCPTNCSVHHASMFIHPFKPQRSTMAGRMKRRGFRALHAVRIQRISI